MTLNFQAVISKNPAIGAEFSKNGSITFKKEEIPAYLLKRNPETAARDKSIARYESRKNSCPTCNLALPATGICDDCA